MTARHAASPLPSRSRRRILRLLAIATVAAPAQAVAACTASTGRSGGRSGRESFYRGSGSRGHGGDRGR